MSTEQLIEEIEIAFERQAEELAALRVHHQREIINLLAQMFAGRSRSAI